MAKIMLVEDDNNLREIYEARLAAEGYEIVSAQNGEEALAMAAKEHPDMIISDVMMPKISGFEMLDILRNTDALRDVKIIMLTALGQAEDSARANSLGADRYLVKSQVTLEDIVKATHDLLDPPASAASDYQFAGSAAASVETPDAPAAPVADEPAPSAPETTPEAPAPQAESTEPAGPTESTEPAPTVAVQQEPAPAPAAPVVSIPVSDDANDIPVPAPDASSSTDVPVAEPPADNTDVPVATPQDDTTTPVDEPAEDYTSPSNFNKFQVSPTVPVEPAAEDTSGVAHAAPQSAADEEASIKAQIDSFISDQDTKNAEPAESDDIAPPAPETTSEPEVVPEPAPATESQPENPVASAAETMPSEQSSPTNSSPIQIPIEDDIAAVPIEEPAPEVLNTYAAPVISPPESPANAQPAPATMDDQLANAAANLEKSAASEEVEKDDSSDEDTPKKKVIEPLSSPQKPSIDQLLALEEAKNSAQQAAAGMPSAPRPNVDAYNPPPRPGGPQTPGPGSSPIDPNSISL